MQSIHRYEDRLTHYIHQQDLAAFRKQHFQQWTFAEDGCSYCIAPEGPWRFFGFVPRHNLAALLTAFNVTVKDIHRLPETLRKRLNPNNLPEEEFLLVAVTQKKEFLYCRLDTTALQNKVEGQKRLWENPTDQQERMQALKRRPDLVPRFLLADL